MKILIANHILDTDPPETEIPPCNASSSAITVKFGLANCYRMSATQNTVFWEACDINSITCITRYRICIQNGSILMDFIDDDASGETCPEPANWVVPSGDFEGPCMRYCDANSE